MIPPQQLIQETIERYKTRSPERDRNIRKLSSGSVLNVDTPERVNRRLERIARNPVAASILSEAKISIDDLSSEEFNRVVQERIIGQRDLMSISYLEYGLKVSRSICRIILRSRSGRVIGYGTGFMVSPRLLLTNNHVLSSVEEAMPALAEFNYQSSIEGQMLQSSAYELDPITFFITNQYLDYSLVAVKEKLDGSPLNDFGWNPLIEEQGKVIVGEYVNIIQHPKGEPKQVALRENQLVDLLDDFLHYQTDTAPGSSGSPVFNDQWEVVGLHHSGVPKMDDQGNYLTIDGSVWTPGMGEDRIAWVANEGIRISQIIKDIKNQQNLSQVQRTLRSGLFDGSQLRLPVVVDVKEQQSITTTINNGIVTWTIPLQVSVNLGQAGIVSSSQTNSVTVHPTPDSQSAKTSLSDVELPDIAPDAEWQAELRQLERLRTGEILYYDQVEDTQNRDQYYSEIVSKLNSLNKSELFNDLHQLLEKTHTRKLDYEPKKYLYPWVDLQPDSKIRSIYSRLEYTPEQIIQEDLLIEKRRASRLQEIILRESLTTAEILERVNTLERDLPYNCEHVVPQSWFKDVSPKPMKGDLHHLFACEMACNSFRGSSPFTDFDDFDNFKELTRNNCGKSEGNRFEPGFGKGEAARATLYFLLRYPGVINNLNKEYKPEHLKTLLDWHKQYPVTEHEKHRNMAIASKQRQGNRNPLIDFPKWTDLIDFSLGIG
ncbi:endonuclease [[Scytonema hofmanni] UTEX B 1581]|nr:endonuclease [[Scytonema hofmanni] UTEX B 1581]